MRGLTQQSMPRCHRVRLSQQRPTLGRYQEDRQAPQQRLRSEPSVLHQCVPAWKPLQLPKPLNEQKLELRDVRQQRGLPVRHRLHSLQRLAPARQLRARNEEHLLLILPG